MRLYKKLQKTMAVVALGAVAMTSVPTFAVDYTGHWAKKAIDKWSAEGILEGYEDGTFRPKDAVTRAELAAIIGRVFDLQSTNGAKQYDDVSLTKWYAEPIRLISAAGIMNDNGNMFRPNMAATREEAAYAIARAYHITGGSDAGFKDANKISEFAIDEITALVAGGYISGRPDGTFAPDATLTRADVVTMIDKITAELINEAGTYNKDIKGNVVVNTDNVILKDMTIDGNLYIAEGVWEGKVELNNIKVTGKVIVEGGGMNTVRVLGKSEIPTLIVNKANNKVRIEVGKDTQVGVVELVSGAKLDGVYNQVVVSTTADVVVGEKAKIDNQIITPEAAGVKINLMPGAEVATMEVQGVVEVAGKGQIKHTVVVDGVELQEVKIPENICNKVTNPAGDKVEINNANPNVGGGGGGGTTPPVVEDPDLVVNNITVGDKVINLADHAVVVNVTPDAITIDGETFSAADSITTATVTTNAPDGTAIKVHAPGMENLGGTFTTGEAYGTAKAVAVIRANMDTVMDMVNNIGFTQGEQDRIAYYKGQLEAKLGQYATDTTVSVQDILTNAQRVKSKLNDPDVVAAWDRLYGEIQAQLAQLGIRVDGVGTNGTITISGSVTVRTEGYDPATIQFTVTF